MSNCKLTVGEMQLLPRKYYMDVGRFGVCCGCNSLKGIKDDRGLCESCNKLAGPSRGLNWYESLSDETRINNSLTKPIIQQILYELSKSSELSEVRLFEQLRKLPESQWTYLHSKAILYDKDQIDTFYKMMFKATNTQIRK